MQSSEGAPRSFIPAASFDWLLPFYDPISRLLGTASLHAALIEQARIAQDSRFPRSEPKASGEPQNLHVLDVGCGTGTLAIEIARTYPGVEVTALDPDPKALGVAQRKAARANATPRFEQGYGDALPFADASFDRVFSSMMFHHLDLTVKQGMLREILRVLRPGGSFHLVDFGEAGEGERSRIARLLHGAEHLRDGDDTTIARLLGEAGFVDVERVAAQRTLFGRVAFHRAARASG